MVGKYQAYPEYRESGNGWLEKVPVTWLNARMDDVALTIKEQVAPRDIESIQVMHYSIPTIQEIGTGREEDGATVDSNKFRVQEGDVLFSKLNPRKQTITTVRSHDQAVVASTEFIVLRSHSDNQQFLQYLLYSQELKSFVCSQVESATKSHQRINPSVVSKLKFALPSKEERLVIVNFLDHETAKIDTLIDKQQQLIQLLKEKRQAVISHAVTKGLNPNAPMRDSGVEWLGEVPEHWGVTRLRFLCDITTGDKDTQDAIEEGDYPFFVRSETIEKSNDYSFDGEGVLTSGDGAGVGKIYHYFVGKCAIHQRVYLFHNFKKIKGLYFYHYIRSQLQPVVLSQSAKSTVDSLRLPMLQNFWVCIPPSKEQEEVIEFLKSENDKLFALISKAELAIKLMQERRTALISAAVTGKIDVRYWSPA